MSKTAVAIRHVLFEDLGILGPLLELRGYRTQYIDAGVEPISTQVAQDPDLLIVLGGPIGVYEEATYPFLVDEREAISARLASGRPTLGICLGAQLIAQALGAEVAPTGLKEIGYAPLTLTAEGETSVLAPLAGISVLHWHGDAFAIPDGAARLAETPGFPNQAFSVSPGVLALQFHAEVDHTQIERWLIGHAHELAVAGVDPVRIRQDAATIGPALAGAATALFTAWLDQVES